MGAIGVFFDFDGRLDRLGYLLRCAALAIVIASLAAYGRPALEAAIGPQGLLGVRTWADWGQVAVMLMGTWSALSLTARRLRDMGAEPAWVVPTGGFLVSLGCVFGGPLVDGAPPPLNSPQAAVTALLALMCAPLALWPSGADARPPRTPRFDPGVHTAYVDWRATGFETGVDPKP